MRSDVSEEPRQGRSTRAGNRSHLNREMDSEEDDDATSWDGGDEEEDEPDQMDLDDDDEDDLADQPSEEEQESQSLVVTLHYRKKSFNTSDEAKPDLASTNGATHSVDIPMADVGAPPQPEAPVVPAAMAASQPAPRPPHVIPTAIANGLSAQQHEAVVAAPKVEHQQPAAEANVLPKLEGFFSAPRPPYSALEEAPKQEQPQFHAVQAQAPQQQQQQQQQPYSTNLPVNNHAPNWQ